MQSIIPGVKLEKAKKVATFDLNKQQNGYLIELYKGNGNNSEKTVAYLTTLKVGVFKGYHLHRIRSAHYICVKGKIKIILYKNKQREEHILDANNPTRLYIPNNTATGLQNIGDEEAWLINYPDPAYDPNLKDEQVEYTQEELEKGVEK